MEGNIYFQRYYKDNIIYSFFFWETATVPSRNPLRNFLQLDNVKKTFFNLSKLANPDTRLKTQGLDQQNQEIVLQTSLSKSERHTQGQDFHTEGQDV